MPGSNDRIFPNGYDGNFRGSVKMSTSKFRIIRRSSRETASSSAWDNDDDHHYHHNHDDNNNDSVDHYEGSSAPCASTGWIRWDIHQMSSSSSSLFQSLDGAGSEGQKSVYGNVFWIKLHYCLDPMSPSFLFLSRESVLWRKWLGSRWSNQ